jgi:hypothetical protein
VNSASTQHNMIFILIKKFLLSALEQPFNSQVRVDPTFNHANKQILDVLRAKFSQGTF